MLFVFAYVDIFGFWRSDVIRGALAKKVPGSGFVIDQRFLLLTTIYVLIPALMIAATMLMPARVTRMASIGVSAVYLVSILVFAIGEQWAYYLVGSGIECLLLLVIAVTAWRWPREAMTGPAYGRDAPEPATRATPTPPRRSSPVCYPRATLAVMDKAGIHEGPELHAAFLSDWPDPLVQAASDRPGV